MDFAIVTIDNQLIPHASFECYLFLKNHREKRSRLNLKKIYLDQIQSECMRVKRPCIT